MATNGRAWPLKLKERCERVGWLVTMSKAGHYKVRTKRGRGFSFPSTPGDRRSELNALAEARRQGLEQLEQRLDRLEEHGRQQRIQRDRDRTSIGAALLSAVVKAEDESKEEGPEVEKEVAQKKGALGYVDGIAIAEKAPAMHETPLTHGKRVPLADGEELLLEDGQVIYRCGKPAATVMDPKAKGVCHRTFETVTSLKAHITYHSRTTVPTTPAQRRAAVAAAERESTRDRVARVAKAAAKKPAPKATETSPEKPGVVARMVALTEKFERLQDSLEAVGKSAEELSGELAALARELPEAVADEITLDKARRYEDLRKHFG